MSYKRLGDLVKVKGGKRLPKGSKLQTTGNSHPYIRVRDMGERYIPRVGLEFVPDEVFPKISRYIVNTNDLIISIVGTIGLVSIIDAYFDGASQTENCAKLTGLDAVDVNFLYYYLNSEKGKQEIREGTVGAVQAKLPLYNIEKIEVYWPDRKEREHVVQILSAIDDKSEVNTQTNQTLEQIAQAIFKSWFVDFEPVKAKMAVLEAGGTAEQAELAAMSVISAKDEAALKQLQAEQPDVYAELAQTAALFPSAMEESELGEIPEGWALGALDDLVDLNKSSWNKKTLPTEIEYVDLSNTKNGVIESTVRYLSADAPSRARRRVQSGDTIFGTVRPGNRSFAYIDDPSPELTVSTGFAVLSPKFEESAEFVYLSVTRDESIEHFAHLADGGAYPAIRPDVVTQLGAVIPSESVFSAFHKSVKGHFKMMASSFSESSILADTRDSLLPKLLSGELPLQESEKINKDALL